MKSKPEIQERLIILTTLKLKHERDSTIPDSSKDALILSIKDQIKVLEWVLGE